MGDDLWQRFQRAEKEIEEELRDVVNEVSFYTIPTSGSIVCFVLIMYVMQANAFQPGWGQTIFQSANELAQNANLRKRITELQAQKDNEREWWESRKKSIEADLLADEAASSEVVEAKKAPSRTSDDDTVLVESGGPVDVKGQQGGSGKKNKKKGKN